MARGGHRKPRRPGPSQRPSVRLVTVPEPVGCKYSCSNQTRHVSVLGEQSAQPRATADFARRGRSTDQASAPQPNTAASAGLPSGAARRVRLVRLLGECQPPQSAALAGSNLLGIWRGRLRRVHRLDLSHVLLQDDAALQLERGREFLGLLGPLRRQDGELANRLNPSTASWTQPPPPGGMPSRRWKTDANGRLCAKRMSR